MKSNIKIAIFNCFEDIVEYTELLYNKKPDRLVRSYVELVNRLYDDYLFEEFIQSKSNRKELQDRFIQIDNLISSYSPKDEFDDSSIVKDSEWLSIYSIARVIVLIWEQDFSSELE